MRSANNATRPPSVRNRTTRTNWTKDTPGHQLFAVLLLLEWSVAVSTALLLTPYTWAGESRWVHLHVWSAIILGGLIVCVPVALSLLRPTAATTRHAVAISQMLMSGAAHPSFGGTHRVSLPRFRVTRIPVAVPRLESLDHRICGHRGRPYFSRALLAEIGIRHLDVEPMAVAGARCLDHFRGRDPGAGLPPIVRQDAGAGDQSAAARSGHVHLERRVGERTADLSMANGELTRQATELRESQTLMASIIESAPDAIVTMDHTGVISEFNPAAVKTFGYSKEEALGRRLEDLIIPEGAQRACDGNSGGRFLGCDPESGLWRGEVDCTAQRRIGVSRRANGDQGLARWE